MADMNPDTGDRRRSQDRELGGIEVRLDILENEVRGLRSEVAIISGSLQRMTGSRNLAVGLLVGISSIAATVATVFSAWMWR